MKRHFFCLGNVSERDMSGRYETPHWNLSIQPSNDLWIDFELILCDEHRTPKRKSCLLYSIEYILHILFRPADRMKRHFFLLSFRWEKRARHVNYYELRFVRVHWWCLLTPCIMMYAHFGFFGCEIGGRWHFNPEVYVMFKNIWKLELISILSLEGKNEWNSSITTNFVSLMSIDGVFWHPVSWCTPFSFFFEIQTYFDDYSFDSILLNQCVSWWT